GAVRIGAGQTQIGDVTAFLVYLAQILLAVMMATFMLMMIPRAAVSAERITEVLGTASSIAPPAQAVASVELRAQVEFRGVRFRYPGAADSVLHDVSFRVTEGQTFAVIGSTGAGKTTLVSLIPRLLDVSEGAVLIDGVDVRELDPDLLWSRIGLVPQRAYLFSGSVASNLRYGNPEATEEQMWRALEIAQAGEFVAAMKGGLEATIAQGGTNISGGQRQRLAIARALVRQPEIYLFDESFSALDLGTEARLRAALRPIARHAAVIIVAQRVATIRDADQIAVLDGGTLVGVGRHADLLRHCPTYAEIVASQLSPEEAA
ncbi:MAG TPA: ABC transporter ATP-binding protein, partial [Steroidobacteraceae bacterium]|nr:ABC transporter ATP-binding protein [Steroidobacteraceae bacterium]